MTALLSSPTSAASPVATPRAARITFDDYLAMTDDGHSYELVDGKLEELHLSMLSSAVGYKVARLLGNHVEPRNLGEVYNSELIYRCFPWKPDNGRKPDASFISAARLPDDWTTLGYTTIAADLVAEVLSPNDLASEVNEKLFEYLRAGVRLVWIIDPEQRVVFVHRLNGPPATLREDDELSGEDVIPGFLCRVADLFPERPVPQAAPALAAEPA